MSVMSAPLRGERQGARSFSVLHFDLDRLESGDAPILLLDDFRVSGRPFGPHPHAGFSAITYVFEDSPGALRSRDSLGNDLVIGPGGIVWLQSASGALHEETPDAFGRELHGAQIYVNLRASNKNQPPATFWLDGPDVPRWSDAAGNVVRVLVGVYHDVASSLTPAEPIDVLDLQVASSIALDPATDRWTLIYARDAAELRVAGESRALGAGEVVAVRGAAAIEVSARGGARLLVLSGAPIAEPRIASGPFILNSQEEVLAAAARYRRGEMGRLDPRP